MVYTMEGIQLVTIVFIDSQWLIHVLLSTSSVSDMYCRDVVDFIMSIFEK